MSGAVDVSEVDEERGRYYHELTRPMQRFVDALVSGMPLHEAARLGGSQAKTEHARKVTATRWRKRPEVQRALAERSSRYDEPGTPEWLLVDEATRVLFTALRDKKHPAVRLRAVETVLKLSGKLGRSDVKGASLAGPAEVPSLPAGEEQRLLAIAMRGRTVTCPRCGCEVPLDGVGDGSRDSSSGNGETQAGDFEL